MKEDAQVERPFLMAREHDDDASSVEEIRPINKSYLARKPGMALILAPAILLLNVAVFFAGMYYGSKTGLDDRCSRHTSHSSPVLDVVGVKYAEQPFDGRFRDLNVFRQKPSPEVDAAWESLGVDYRAGVIPYEAGIAAGLTDEHLQVSEEHGGGFLVNVEGMHHLHCLNLVRKSLYFNHKYYKHMGGHEFKNNGTILEDHITHCLDTVRQTLMCHVDTGVLGQVWVDPKAPVGFPDFESTHTCKNYEAIRQYAESIQAPPNEELPEGWVAQPKPGSVREAAA